MSPNSTVPQWAKDRQARGVKFGYRSGLEEKIAKKIKEAGLEVRFETFKIPYVMPESRHTYTPDFILPNRVILEGKGIFDASDRAKHLLVRAQYPALDIRLVFTRSSAPINPGSKTTYADWCRKHDIKFCDKLPPDDWLREQGPQKDPMEVIKNGPFGFAKTPPSR